MTDPHPTGSRAANGGDDLPANSPRAYATVAWGDKPHVTPDRAAKRKVRGRLAQYTQLEKAIYLMLDTGRDGRYVRVTVDEIITEWYENLPDEDFCRCGGAVIRFERGWICETCGKPALEMARA
jgi:hypothetical protein